MAFRGRMDIAPRVNWKGTLKIGELSCALALYTAASTADRIAFDTINWKTGNGARSAEEAFDAIPEQKDRGRNAVARTAYH